MRTLVAIASAAVVGVACPVAAVAAVSNGTYRGRTSQGLRIRITVKGHAITDVRTSARDSCSPGAHGLAIGDTHRIKSDGRFRIAAGPPGPILRMTGHFRAGRASGSIRTSANGCHVDIRFT